MLTLELIDLSQESRDFVHRLRQSPDIQNLGLLNNSEEISDDLFQWRYFSAAHIAPPVFILLYGQKIGYVRFRPFSHQGSYEVSIALIPEYHGFGYGKKALDLAEKYAKRQGISSLFAMVKRENLQSINFFEKMGYIYVQEGPSFRPDETLFPFLDQKNPLLLYKKSLIKNDADSLFLIAEIGSNWITGSQKKNREMAKRLISIAKESGCDAVKFQVYRARETYASGSGKSSYLQKSGIDEDITALFHEHEAQYEDIPYLADMASKCGIEFMATAFSKSTFSMIDPYVQRHKIASYEISDPALLECAAQSQKPLLLSTGAASLRHIGWALGYLKKQGLQEKPTLLQCTAAYPADENDAQLSVLKTLQSAFGCRVGLSDHTANPTIAPLIAIAFGATVIEKHITISKQLPGPDHAFALEPHELQEMVIACRSAKKMVGDGQKRVLESEKELFFFAQRALQATSTIEKDDLLQIGKNMAFLRPGVQKKGAHPSFLDQIEGKKANRSIDAGEGIDAADVQY